MNVSPKKMLEITKGIEKSIKAVNTLTVAVGLPKGDATSKIYGDGTSVVTVGAAHEYGAGKAPQRSFLRVPFTVKKEEIKKALAQAFKLVFEHKKDAELQLELVGVRLQNISKEAFSNNGYGTWPPLKEKTIEAKRSSKPLIDTGTLRSSITYEVRNAT